MFHPTFLYECIWNLGAFGLVIWADHRFKLGYGRVMALYVMAYTAGRGWIEYIRVDDVQLDDVYGLRFNVWVSIVLFVAAAAYFVWSAAQAPGPRGGDLPAGSRARPARRSEADEAEETDEAIDEPAESVRRDRRGTRDPVASRASTTALTR